MIGFFLAHHRKGINQLNLDAVSGRLVSDLQAALKQTLINAATLYAALLFGGYFLHLYFTSTLVQMLFLSVPALMIGYLTIHFINVWRSYNFGILVDAGSDLIDIPASDVENSFMELITFKQFFDHAQRESLALSDIERIDNYTERSRGERYFHVTITGRFGSRMLTFSSKQKRDEFRNAVYSEYRKLTGAALNGDFNVDF